MAAANGGNTYKSSHSVNKPNASNAGSYNAQRNGQRPYNPQTNQQQAQQQNQMANQQRAKQLNMAKKQQEQQEDGDGLSQGQQIKKQVAKKTLTEAAKAYNPAVGAAVEKALETKKGDAYLDEFAKGESVQDGVKKVVHKAKEEQRKRNFKIYIATALGPLLFLVLIIAAVYGKNADSQKYANENEGQIDEIEELDNTDTNVFKNYPGMYEKVEEYAAKVSKEEKVPIDKYLILATLIAPLDNGLIIPYEGKCHSDIPEYDKLCYKFVDYNGKEEELGFEKFIEKWSTLSELLGKMQILHYVDVESGNKSHSKLNKQGKVNCGSVETMEQYAKNDKDIETRTFWSYFNPFSWGKEYNDYIKAETNAKCTHAPVYPAMNAYVPDVPVLSIDQGTYYSVPKADGTGFDYYKEEDTGGVYFWNLVNQNGFIDIYFQPYLAYEKDRDPDVNYENNKAKILEIGNYIYSYYESIRKDCDGYEVMESAIETIDFREDGSSPIYTLDFEDVFVGGSVLATYGSATGEVAKAQAIITRSEAYNYIVEQGGKVITGSAKMGCWWWKYNATYDPDVGIVKTYTGKNDKDGNPIYTYEGGYDPDYPKEHYKNVYDAVTETRGIVVTKYVPVLDDGKGDSDYIVMETEYDAFCPQNRELRDGFWVLPDGQRDLPIYGAGGFTVSEKWTRCPCFKNKSSMPKDKFGEDRTRYTYDSSAPTYTGGTPAQETLSECWEQDGTRYDDEGELMNKWTYSATGGHGRGVSQHGMRYFASYGYKWDAILGLFLDRDNYGIAFRRLSGTLEMGECQNAIIHRKINKEET